MIFIFFGWAAERGGFEPLLIALTDASSFQGAKPLGVVFRPQGHSAPAFAFLFMHALRTGSSAHV